MRKVEVIQVENGFIVQAWVQCKDAKGEVRVDLSRKIAVEAKHLAPIIESFFANKNLSENIDE